MAPRSPSTASSLPGGSPGRGLDLRRHPEIPERPRRRRETPGNMAALALRGPQGRFPGRQASSPSAKSRGRPKGAEEGPGRPGAPAGSRPPPATGPHVPDTPPQGAARDGTRPSRLVRAEGTETHRDLQAAAPARTAPIMRCRPAGPPDAGRRPKGGNRTMTPAPPAERPHGPGKPPSRVPSRPFSAEAGTSGNPGNWR